MNDRRRWRCLCAYDGTVFAGWQSQVHGNAIQNVLERCLEKIFHQPISVVGSGRTDAGVHACGQVFHFDGPLWRHGVDNLLRAINSNIPPAICVRAAAPADSTFHARFSATGKRYDYYMVDGFPHPIARNFSFPLGGGPFDAEAFRRAAALFLGNHDFSSFSNRGSEKNSCRTIVRSELLPSSGGWIYRVEGTGFLHRMVRRMVGALLEVARGKISGNDIGKRLLAPGTWPALPVAPPQGLFLKQVFYARHGAEEMGLDPGWKCDAPATDFIKNFFDHFGCSHQPLGGGFSPIGR